MQQNDESDFRMHVMNDVVLKFQFSKMQRARTKRFVKNVQCYSKRPFSNI